MSNKFYLLLIFCGMCWGEESFSLHELYSFCIVLAKSSVRYTQTFQVLSRKQEIASAHHKISFLNFVPGRGLEPPWITPLVPKTSASTNFATPAFLYIIISKRCPPTRARTWDRLLKRELLYQLSYRRLIKCKSIFCAAGGSRTHTSLRPLDFKSRLSTNSSTATYGGHGGIRTHESRFCKPLC
jgi:hypothetical protein